MHPLLVFASTKLELAVRIVVSPLYFLLQKIFKASLAETFTRRDRF